MPWLESKGAVRVGHQEIQLTVTGNRRDPVRIMDMVAVKQCQEPLDGTYFHVPSAGGSPSLSLTMNMEDPRPRAMVEAPKDPSGDSKVPTPYFDANTVTLDEDEQFVFVLTVRAEEAYCTFDLDLSVLEGDTLTTQSIDNNGGPFAVTPEMPRTDWQQVYITGVNCIGRGLEGFVPADGSWYEGENVDVC